MFLYFYYQIFRNLLIISFGNSEMKDSLERLQAHLMANKLDSENWPLTIGKQLHFNADIEKFVNDADADKYLTREYRKGFEVNSNS